MKIANVVSVQSRGISGTSAQGAGSRLDRMSNLLRRYPDIEDQERRELLAFLTGGPPEEVVEVSRLRGLEQSYRRFRADHPREFSSDLRAWLPMILLVAITIVAVAWRWLG